MTEQEIYERWPGVFPDRPDNTEPQTSCMFWGLEVPDSWLPVIADLAEALQSLTSWTSSRARPQPWPVRKLKKTFRTGRVSQWLDRRWPARERAYYGQVVAQQVKSKCGGLRFYYEVHPHPEHPKDQTDFRTTMKLADGMIMMAETIIANQG